MRRLVYTSFAGAGPTATADHSVQVHWPTEQALMASGMNYTVLRHALYADAQKLMNALEAHDIVGPAWGSKSRVVLVDREHLAAALNMLARDFTPEGS